MHNNLRKIRRFMIQDYSTVIQTYYHIGSCIVYGILNCFEESRFTVNQLRTMESTMVDK